MKPQRCGNIQIRINVMHVVKAPKKRDSMISEMPVVKRQIHQQKAHHKFEPHRKCDDMDQTKGSVRRPMQSRANSRLHQSDRDEKHDCRQAKVDEKATQQRTRASAQRKNLSSTNSTIKTTATRVRGKKPFTIRSG